MQALPHTYVVSATAQSDSDINTLIEGKAPLTVAPPKEFGGAGVHWSPEDLLNAAVADCFILSFKAIAAANKLDWQDVSCKVEGVLDKVDRAMAFTHFQLHAELTVSDQAAAEKAPRLLERAEKTCLVSNSLNSSTALTFEVVIA